MLEFLWLFLHLFWLQQVHFSYRPGEPVGYLILTAWLFKDKLDPRSSQSTLHPYKLYINYK